MPLVFVKAFTEIGGILFCLEPELNRFNKCSWSNV